MVYEKLDYTNEQLSSFLSRLDFGDKVYILCITPLGLHMLESTVKIINMKINVDGFTFNDFGYNEEYNVFIRPYNEKTLNFYLNKTDEKFLKVLVKINEKNRNSEKISKLMIKSFEEILEENIYDDTIKNVLIKKYKNNIKTETVRVYHKEDESYYGINHS